MSGWGPRTDEGSQGTVIIAPGSCSVQFQQVFSVPGNTTQTILDYTTPAGGKTLFLNRVEFGGSNIGNFTLLIGASLTAQHYTHYCDLNGSWVFEAMNGGLTLGPSTRIQVQVIHPKSYVGDFYARLNLVSP